MARFSENDIKLFIDGSKSAVPIVLGYLPLGFACGVISNAAGMNIFQIGFMSLIVFAGAGQYIAAGMIMQNSSPVTIGLTILIVNLRHLLYTSALSPFLQKFSFRKKALFAAEITDETFAVHSLTSAKEKELLFPKALGLNITSHASWIIGNIIGGVSGSLITNGGKIGLDFALPALFIALIIPRVKEEGGHNSPQILALLSAALFSFVFYLLGLSYLGVIVASVLASSVALFYQEHSYERS